MRALFFSALLFLAPGSTALAQDWQIQSMGAVSDAVFAQRCTRASQSGTSAGLPDGCVVRGNGDVRSAWYVAPTTRYGHGILGDAIEAGGLSIELANGAQTTLTLPDDHVFEDRTPRLADLDGDGSTEIITIRSSTRLGGSVTVYGVRGEALVELAATPYIGRSNRWLNIAGIADFTGQGGLQVAFVETPHIGGTLKLAAFDGRSMLVIAQRGGFSNHAIRSREQQLSFVDDMDGDGLLDLILPNARRDQLVAVTFSPSLEVLAQLPLPSTVEQMVGEVSSDRAFVRMSAGPVLQVSW